MSDLKPIVGKAYQEIVLSRASPRRSLEMFRQAGVDQQFINMVNDRLHQLNSGNILKQCFVSKKEHEFLTMAIEHLNEHGPMEITTKLPDIDWISKPTQEENEDMTTKLSGLAGLAKTIVSKVEADAERALNDLQAAEVKAQGGIGHVKNITGTITQSAADLEDFANQITNGGPPLDHP